MRKLISRRFSNFSPIKKLAASTCQSQNSFQDLRAVQMETYPSQDGKYSTLFEGVCPRFPFSLTSCKIIIIPWNKLSQRPCWDFPVVSNVVNPNKPDRKGAAALWIKKQIKSFLNFKFQLAIPQSKGVLDKPKWPLPVLHQVFSPPRKLSLISSQRATGK